MCHQASARRITHTLSVTVYHPKASDEYNHSGGSLSGSVEEMEEPVHLRAETYQDVHHSGKQESEGHHLLAGNPVCKEAVDEPGNTVDDSVKGQEETELGLAYSKFGLECRHRNAEVLPDEIEQHVPYHQQDEGPPLPVVVFLLGCLIHFSLAFDNILIQDRYVEIRICRG